MCPAFSLVAGPSRINATANYRHAVNDLQRGVLTAHADSNQVQLARFQSLVKDRPGLRGLLNLNGDVTAAITPAAGGAQFQLTALNANAAAHGLEMEGKALGDVTATASTAGAAIHYNVDSNFAGSTIRVSGQSLLAGDHETSASASIANLPIDRVLAVAGRRDLPLKGTLTANAQLGGTLQNPRGSGTLAIANGSAYNQPFTRVQASLNYTEVLVDVSELRVEDGPSNIDLSASFNHAAGNLQEGQLHFRARSNQIQLARVKALADARPGLAGLLQLTADGAATLHRNAPIAFSTLNGQIEARNLSMNKKDLGGLTATANAHGNGVAFTVNSDFAKANIRGSGRLDLTERLPDRRPTEFHRRNLVRTGHTFVPDRPALRRIAGWPGHGLRSRRAHRCAARKPATDQAGSALGGDRGHQNAALHVRDTQRRKYPGFASQLRGHGAEFPVNRACHESGNQRDGVHQRSAFAQPAGQWQYQARSHGSIQ